MAVPEIQQSNAKFHCLHWAIFLFAFFTGSLTQADTANSSNLCPDSIENAGMTQATLATFVQLIGRCPDANAGDENGWTDLHWAAVLNLPELLGHLLDQGLDIDVRTKNDGAQFSDQLMVKLLETKEQLALPLPDNSETYTRANYTALHWAALSHSKAAAELAIAKGADIHTRTSARLTPLHLAAYSDALQVATLLIDSGADIDAKSDNGETSLHWAVANDSTAMVQLLIKRGADISATERYKATPLHWAALTNAIDSAEVLIQYGADVNAISENDSTPLHLAAWYDQVEITILLIKHGADITAKTQNG